MRHSSLDDDPNDEAVKAAMALGPRPGLVGERGDGVEIGRLERQDHGVGRAFLGDRFEGYSGGAAWQDAKLGLDHHGRWHRAAIVTDTDWLRHLAGAFGWMVPGAFEVFPLAERADAIAWVAADD